MVTNIQTNCAVNTLVETAMASISHLRSNPIQVTGTPTGLYDLDHVIDGFQPGNLYVIGARPGMGKTNFALGCLVHASVVKMKSVAIYSTTTDSKSLTLRMLAQMASVPLKNLYRGGFDDSQWLAIQDAEKSLAGAALQMTESDAIDSWYVAQSAKTAFQQRNMLDLFVVDGLQRFKPISSIPDDRHEGTGIQNHMQSSDIEALLRNLKDLALRLNCPVLLTWQLGPEIDQRTSKRPTIADLQLTEVMEDAIDSVMLLFREDAYRVDDRWDGEADITIVRNRHGSTGWVRLACEIAYSRFRTFGLAAESGTGQI
jgi:replicative DNA helicase